LSKQLNKEHNRNKFLRIIAVVGVIFAGMFGFPNNAYAQCVNYIQSQTIANAYNGDLTPTVHTMDTCGGDDTSYQIPIATNIVFDGVTYENVYATTNSVITFGQPDGTFHTYPSTPSISLYSMDWVSGYGTAQDTLNISYSEGGFQLDLEVIPFGQWDAPTPSNINIIVAITNTGGISVAYSYQGPEYQNLRTGVRLHSGQIVTLEQWGATQIQPGSSISLPSEPISGPITGPTEEPMTVEEQQAAIVEAVTLANDIANLNYLIANINGEDAEEPSPEPTPEPTQEPDLPDSDIEVEPEIITPEDPRFPDEEEQIEPEDPNPSPSSDTTNEENEETDPSPEPSEDASPQPEDTNQPEEVQPEQPVDVQPSNPSTDNSISEEELKQLNKLISENDAKLIAQLVQSNEVIKQAVIEFTERAEENADAPMPYTVADAITEVQAEQILEDPIGAMTAIFTEIDMEVLTSPTEWGKDMTDDQREKVQEIVVSVIIASNLVSASMTRRK